VSRSEDQRGAEVVPIRGGGATATRVMPWSKEAEMSVVGGILLFPDSFARVADVVAPADFYHPAHAVIYAAMVELDQAGKPIDSISVADQMRADDTMHKLRALNGEGYFVELTSAVVTVENIAFQARLVASKARVRRIIEAGQTIAARGYGDYGDDDDFCDEAERDLFVASQSRLKTNYTRLEKILGPVIKTIEKRYDRKQAITGIPTGLTKIDEMTAGFQPGDLVIIAARPSMGKTSLVMNAVANAAVEFGVPALVFSLEMSKESLVERLICSEARIDSTRLRSGFLEQRDWIAMSKAAARIAKAPIDIDDSGAPTLLDIRARARRWRAENPGSQGIIVVDYLQLVDPQKEKGQSDASAVAKVSRGLKSLAKELRVPLVALSQLSRAVEERADKRPVMSDLRDSGAIEQDADGIIFIYRDSVYHNPGNCDGKKGGGSCGRCARNEGVAEAIFAKQRNGPVGTVRLRFIGEYTRFEDLREE